VWAQKAMKYHMLSLAMTRSKQEASSTLHDEEPRNSWNQLFA
jgi:hypothetical protein